MIGTAKKVMVQRCFMIWSMLMNLPRLKAHFKSAETHKITTYMTEQPATPGVSDVFGWNEERSVYAGCLGDPKTIKVLRENQLTITSGEKYSIIDSEMEHRKVTYARLSKEKGPELIAFQAEFCDENGDLVNLAKVDPVLLYVGYEGHHRGLQCFLDAHTICVSSDPQKKFSLNIPVIPATFDNLMELMKFQAMGNAADGAQNRLTRMDIVNLAFKQYSRIKNGSEFRYLMGEAVPKRITGQETDKEKAAAAKRDAGTFASLAFSLAELADKFPQLGVWECLTADKTESSDHVSLSDLSANPKPDPLKCVTSILQMTDKRRLQEYMEKWGASAPVEVARVWGGGQDVEDRLYTKEQVAEWWEGRKSGKGRKPQTQAKVAPEVPVDLVRRWSESKSMNQYAVMAAQGFLEQSSDAFMRMEDKEFTDQSNCLFDIQTNTPYGELFAELARRTSAAHTAKVDCTKALQDCVEIVKHLFKEQPDEPVAPSKQAAPAKPAKAGK